MALLFSYGTLQEDSVQMNVFGRLLTGAPDELRGFEQSTLTLRTAEPGGVVPGTYPVVRPNGREDSCVRGTVYEVSNAELEITDRYETSAYKRVAVTLASGRRAWVYADARFA